MQLALTENVSLKAYNTFGVEAKARYFLNITDPEQLALVYTDTKFDRCPKLIVGSGSNILFVHDFDGLVIHMDIPGIDVEEAGDVVYIEAGAGVLWNDLVQFCVQNGLAGVENLTLIPGTVGAAPVQNIGAYGVELKDVFHSCEVYDTANRQYQRLIKSDCHFAYRDSLFKTTAKGRYVILRVKLVLSRIPNMNTAYGAIEAELRNRQIDQPSIADISKVVADIRVSKLPDPSTIGNGGSFFKNPIIEFNFFRQLQSAFVDIVYFPLPDGKVKLAAGWLIDRCGWKGVRVGDTGTWKNQALVLVNYGSSTGLDIYNFSEKIIKSVYAKFGILLEREVNLIGL